jgi:hypothetical protein
VADNATVDNGTLTDYTVAADDLAGVLYPRVKVNYGTDGNATDTSTTNPLPVHDYGVATATLTNVAGSATSVTLKASNAARRVLVIYNDSSADLYVKWGATASLTSFTHKIASQGMYELPQPIYTGIVDGIWSSATGNARVTEA